MTTGAFVRLVVGLKWRLLSAPTSRWQKVSFRITMLLGVVLIPATVFVVWWQRSTPDAASLLMVVFTALAVAWLVFTIVGGGGETVLDPTLFSIYPISERRLVAGFLGAAFVGVPALVTLSAAFAATTHAPSPLAVLLVVVGAIVFSLTAVVTGRVGITWMSGMLRGRRTREIATWVAAIIGSAAGLIGPLASEFEWLDFDAGAMVPIRRVLRFLPWGWAPESIALATEGRVGRALLMLIPAVAFGVVLLRYWVALLERILTSKGVAPQAEVDGGLVPAWMTVFGSSPTIAVWARALRQLRRDPRELLEVAAFMPAVVLFALPGIDALRSGDDRAVLSSASIGLALGITTLNMFGADGRSFGVDALAADSFRHVVAGKAFARMSLGLPLVLVVALVMSAVSGGWVFLVPTLAIAVTTLTAMSAVGIHVSTRAPFPLPEKATMGGGQNQGCTSAIIRVIAMLIALIVAAPGVALVTVVSLVVGPAAGSLVGLLSIAYGVGLFWLSTQRSGRWADRHVPEMFRELAASP